MPDEYRLVGTCTRCGGDVLDNGKVNKHRCPRVRPEAAAIVQVKQSLDGVALAIARRPWASVLRRDEVTELRQAVREAQAALSAAYPADVTAQGDKRQPTG